MKIELRNICKDFKDKVVLKDICFQDDINSIAIIGPSGGGKSTLLRIMGGLIVPDSGEMYLDGDKINFDEKSLQIYRRNIGFVFQSKGLFEHLTALENVTLPLIYTFGVNKVQSVEIADKLFARFGLSKEKNKYPFQLSGGQQQRIALARAVAIKPKLLLLDEPTSALDPEYTSEVLDMLKELQGDGLDTIIVTHEMGFAKNACEKVIFLGDNKIIESGKSTEIFKNPKSKEVKTFLNKILEWNA
ncbi:amino acid ABC transporter ATP-binding protein [Clostridium grantii]|uniref:Polar amino acid transport system ATP-binding protein n=1 Tax=Clostridium grantii DSM 8605 TaxID=1121316 RepID=A0A1M5VCW4_9CLOT|nr:amino acid ABC transporter ATP-binding protein [Clostridium grantii]SHH72988.1 polar amino acid transport system ATP-binding protein [Clostridium grantii DSM 8605]